eukprot:scaffold2709_cov163-Ochromonas_danica.AAC.13
MKHMTARRKDATWTDTFPTNAISTCTRALVRQVEAALHVVGASAGSCHVIKLTTALFASLSPSGAFIKLDGCLGVFQKENFLKILRSAQLNCRSFCWRQILFVN